MSGKSAVLLGATGAVGKHVLRELILSGEYTRVGEFGRRTTPTEQLPPNAKAKLEAKEIDFEKLGESGLKDGKWDVVFITLGTTRATAGSAAAFEKIDREYVVNAAREAKSNDPSHKQRLVYLSTVSANADSPFLYLKSKGTTENELASLGYSDTIIFRPGFLANAERAKPRLAESLAGPVFSLLNHIMSVRIDVSNLGKAITRAGLLGSSALPDSAYATKAKAPSGAEFTIIANAGAENLAKD